MFYEAGAKMDEQLEMALKGSDFKHLIDIQFDEIKKNHNLKKVEIEVLFFLSKCGSENTPTDVSRRLNLNRGHVSQAIDVLLKRGYIQSVPDAQDRRCMHYTVTEHADPVIREIASAKQKMDAQILKGITEEELALYKEISDRMIQNIRELLGIAD
jgi:DNA-binding MarR family transcriptional regulator